MNVDLELAGERVLETMVSTMSELVRVSSDGENEGERTVLIVTLDVVFFGKGAETERLVVEEDLDTVEIDSDLGAVEIDSVSDSDETF